MDAEECIRHLDSVPRTLGDREEGRRETRSSVESGAQSIASVLEALEQGPVAAKALRFWTNSRGARCMESCHTPCDRVADGASDDNSRLADDRAGLSTATIGENALIGVR